MIGFKSAKHLAGKTRVGELDEPMECRNCGSIWNYQTKYSWWVSGYKICYACAIENEPGIVHRTVAEANCDHIEQLELFQILGYGSTGWGENITHITDWRNARVSA